MSAIRVSMIIIAMEVLSGCGVAGTQVAAEETAAKNAIQALLIDPASAQFRGVNIHSSKAGPVSVCGEVNAKNRMGGYNGFQKFYYVIATQEAAIDPPSPGATPGSLVTSAEVNAIAAQDKFMVDELTNCSAAGVPSLEESKAAQAKAEADLRALNSR